jgi:hypothetical protein
MGGYLIGRSDTARRAVEVGHEVRTLARNFRDGGPQETPPDMLDYMRAGASISNFGSSPWLAMRLSPSLRAAYDEIGGQRNGAGARDAVYDGDGEPVGNMSGNGRRHSRTPADEEAWRQKPATPRQLAYLRQLGVDIPGPSTGSGTDLSTGSGTDLSTGSGPGLNRGQASDLIGQAQNPQGWQTETADNNPTNGYSQPQQPGTAGYSQPVTEQALVQRFAGLEQALAALTEALTNPDGSGRTVNRQTGEPAVNGPIPDWLQEEGRQSSGEAAQDTRRANAAPASEEDKDSHIDRKSTRQGGGQNADPSASATPSGRPEDETGTTPTANIRLEPDQDFRRLAIQDTLARLEEPHSPAGQAAAQTLVIYIGQERAGLIGSAVSEHTAAPIQEAAEATANLTAQYRNQGLDDAGVLAAFQSGEAAAAIRQVLDTPLSEEQLSAVADMVLLPQRRLSQTELVTVIGQEVAAGATSEQAVVQALGSPVGFGGQTGNVRGVMAGAQAMNLSPAELARLAGMIQAGLREAVQAELAGRGYGPEVVQDFVSDMAALPNAIVIPQTTVGGSNQEV